MRGLVVPEIIDTSNSDEISAIVAATFISQTYKVESTRSIVDFWDKIRKNIKVQNNLDFVSVLLTIGRLMDVKEELDDEKFIQMLTEISTTILRDLKNRGHVEDINNSNFVTALISSAFISSSNGIETINEIIEYWERINNEIVLATDLDQLAGVLTIGRIMEGKYQIDDMRQIIEVHNKLKESLLEIIDDDGVEQIHLAAAFLANAYIEITPKVERIQDMVLFWLEVQKDLVVKDNIDYITSILTYGRIRDLKEQYFITDSDISEIKNNLRKFIEMKN